MARRPRRGAVALLGGLVPALTAAPFSATAAAPAAAPPADGSGMVMVLDSSGSMAGGDGSGSTRIAAARRAVGTVADALPAGYPVGLRVYGADKPKRCDDTRLAQPVAPLDRAGLKRAVAGVRPKGDTPIGLSLRKAAEDLSAPAGGATGKRTILLLSDGEDNCQAPPPCKVAAQLAASGVDLRIDAIGFQVAGKARTQLECIAKAGNGRYYDAPDAASLARQVQRAGQLSVDGYRFKGRPLHGTAARGGAPSMGPGQYLDSIGPNEERYYAVGLDAISTADFSATVVPQPGVTVGLLDTLRTRIAHGTDGTCASDTGMFGQTEGATPLTASVRRVPSQSGYGSCDTAGRYWLVVERRAAKGSDATRWPMELTFHVEFANEPTVKGHSSTTSYGGTQVYTPFRTPVGSGTGLFDPHVPYDGRLASLSMGTVPVAWTNRYEGHPDVIPVHAKGNFYIAVTLGAKASEIAQHPRIGVVLRAAVLGKEKSGPEAGAATGASDIAATQSGPSPDGAQGGSGGWSTGRVVALAVGGVGVLLLAGLALAYIRARRKSAAAGGNSDR
ncbi:vWA domain-containing protein [Streptomyces lydicus]|uniref:vWA domain-containing protein n=1 Tax=Streptomyces lydicus TaxID=47763 RepID=UPI0036FD6800